MLVLEIHISFTLLFLIHPEGIQSNWMHLVGRKNDNPRFAFDALLLGNSFLKRHASTNKESGEA